MGIKDTASGIKGKLLCKVGFIASIVELFFFIVMEIVAAVAFPDLLGVSLIAAVSNFGSGLLMGILLYKDLPTKEK